MKKRFRRALSVLLMLSLAAPVLTYATEEAVDVEYTEIEEIEEVTEIDITQDGETDGIETSDLSGEDSAESVEEAAASEAVLPEEGSEFFKPFLAATAPERSLPKPEMGAKTASPVEIHPGTEETTVTLKLPSAEYRNEYDIMFVMDNSTSIDSAGINLQDEVEKIYNAVKEYDVYLNIGVVKFRGYPTDMIGYVSEGAQTGLVRYSEDTKTTIDSAITAKAPGSGTSIHGGLMLAEKILSEDTGVSDDHKFLILLTDGKSYIWDDGNGNPTTNYIQWVRNGVIQNTGIPQMGQGEEYDKYNWDNETPSGWPEVLKADGTRDEELTSLIHSKIVYFSSVEDLVQNGTDDATFDEPSTYQTDKKQNIHYTGITKKTGIANSSLLRPVRKANDNGTFNTLFEVTGAEEKYLELNPFNYDPETNSWDVSKEGINENFYMFHMNGSERATYKSAVLFRELAGKYHAAVIYSAKDSGYRNLSTYIFNDFGPWCGKQCERSALYTDTEKILDIFKNIKTDILYLIHQGVVTDTVPAEFELQADSFAMTLSGAALAKTEAGENTWNFGEAAATDGSYPYSVIWYPAEKKFEWVINVPIENAKPVTLSYDLTYQYGVAGGRSSEIQTDTALHDTNVSAILNYTSSTGERGEYEFPVPAVTVYAPYKTEHYLQNPDGTYSLSETDRSEDLEGSTVTAEEKTYELYNLNPEAEGTVLSGTVLNEKAEEKILVLRLYYDLKTAGYKVEHYKEQTDGSFALADTEDFEDVVGQTVTGEEKSYENYTYSEELSKDTKTGKVEGDGSLTLKLYYELKKAPYKVEHYVKEFDKEYTLEDTENFEEKIGKAVTADPKVYEKFYYCEEDSKDTKSGSVLADGSLTLKLYYRHKKVTVNFVMNGHGNQVPDQVLFVGTAPEDPGRASASGYSFTGWYADKARTELFDYTTLIMEDTTVYAGWRKEDNGGGGGGGGDVKPTPPSPTTPPAPKGPEVPSDASGVLGAEVPRPEAAPAGSRVRTGDTSNLKLYLSLLGASALLLGALAVTGKKKEDED